MKPLLTIFLIANLPVICQQTDPYSKAHALMQAAEAAAVHLPPILDDRSDPLDWAGHLYARAGYLEESARAYRRAASTPFALVKASVLYGDLPRAEKIVSGLADPAKRANAQLCIVEVLWRIGEAQKAQAFAAEARKSAAQIALQAHRASLTAVIDETSRYLNDEPPNHLSPKPAPPLRLDAQDSLLPPFPITPNGFADRTVSAREKDANADSQRMKDLFARIEARDQDGLFAMLQSAATPFQKALTFASLENLMIQAAQPEPAENMANQIPESDDECSLAKAEALTAAGADWFRSGNADRAGSDFAAALKLAQSAREWPVGQVTVIVGIAEAQARAGLTASSEESLRVALQIAPRLPITHEYPRVRHNRSEVYGLILVGAINSHNLGLARATAESWKAADNKSTTLVVDAYLRANQVDEATVFVAAIGNTAERVKAQLALAQTLLDLAGAPNI